MEDRLSSIVMIDSDDKVWPMVAPGAAISDAFDEADLKNK